MLLEWLVVAEVGAGRVEVDEGGATPPAVFDVSHTERHLGVIPSARAALRDAVRATRDRAAL